MLDEVSLIVGNQFLAGVAAVFGVSSIVTCGWYIKYITNTTSVFGPREFRLYIPLVALLILLVIGIVTGASYAGYFYNIILLLMIGLIFYYFYFCIDMLRKHQRLIREYYSGKSGNITVNWMIVIVTLQITEFVLKGVLGRVIHSTNRNLQIITNEYCYIIEIFLLVVLGIWQKSIPVLIATNDEDVVNEALPAVDLKHYQQKLERFMTDHKPYLDPELTIEKLSELSKIRKVLLSQTLNKGINKNFFTFIKEYRIRHVQQILEKKTNEKATIMEIAYESGFNSKTGFNRAFKEVTGKTPTEYLSGL